MAPARTPGPWVSASELADYAYCPRSWWYGRHPPAAGRTRDGVRSSEAGIRYHERALAREWRRERDGPAYLVLLAVAVVLVIGGLLWILF
ncbi:MAG: hypothetical protein L3K06_00820 [Thermoplasmata archaeon]|nr:hypothetical protein [Thermoplasmata archaeon]MCI4353892.1 hypothetical protein [Thermoplasmata archaeon]